MPDELDLEEVELPETAFLWRRIPPWHYKFEENAGDFRPTTAAFEDNPDGQPMSAYIADECAQPENALAGHDGYGLVAIPISVLKAKNMKIVRQEVEGPRGHVGVVGKKTDGVRKAIKRASIWVVRAREEDNQT